MRIGILALQGDFAEHEAMVRRADGNVETLLIRQKRDLDKPIDGLVLPGGESTTMKKLLLDLGLFEPLRGMILEGLPVYGTCAGLILLSREVDGGEVCFGTMDITVKRNAYGRQLGSFYTTGEFSGMKDVPMTFIRAPYIVRTCGKAVPLASVDGKIVAAREGNQLVTAFHPELNDDRRIYNYFLEMCGTAEHCL